MKTTDVEHKKNYWMHRCNHENGLAILDSDQCLTIGFSDCAKESKMVAAIQNKDRDNCFDRIYEEIYEGEIWRSRYSLWYFTCEMSVGDIVVVPRPGGFSICRLTDGPIVSLRRTHCDIGFEWKVEFLTQILSPRENYAPAGLLFQMKCRQTTIKINDLAEDVETAIARYCANKPFSLPNELSEQCYKILAGYSSPDHLERLVQDYFTRLGAKTEILPKNYSGKEGDCDVSAVFPALRLTISVQVKRHWGVTCADAVNQIKDYATSNKQKVENTSFEDENWTFAEWVVSMAEEFSDEAKAIAKENRIVLLNGKEFCSMLIANGLGV